ncbi:Pyruvate kinase [Corynebacterium occultum]|uniref:pyruvate kinase n=1 Tax=Corynebacterium occultum TaxID=2675219 RepID=A0A6B8W4S1_9CORY|nr:pyruvate kinase [Corynebacterium occultum]QGU08564.1 Pyruvate kinase [Corynebacterium occultum]
MDPRLEKIISQIDELLAALDEEVANHAAEIDAVAPAHRDGAINLVHYARLRTLDIRELQSELTQIGATRLTTTEPAVKARLEAARAVTLALGGQPQEKPWEASEDAFSRADEILEDHADLLLGKADDNTHSRIMVTLPAEAATDPELVRGFVEAGMEVARINCAHDDEQAWQGMIDHVRAAAAEVGREVRVAMDLAGPKVRTGEIEPGPAVNRARVTRTEAGEVTSLAKLWLSPAGQEAPEAPELPGRPTLELQVDPAWFEKLEEGSRISLVDVRDSRRQFTVTRVAEGAVLAEGHQNAYISTSTLLEHDFEKSRVHGVEPLEQNLRLEVGDQLVLSAEQTPCDPSQEPPVISCTLPEAVEAIEVGQNVLFDDGAIAAKAVDKRLNKNGYREVELDIIRAKPGGTKLAAYKGINLPETDLPLPSLTADDIAHLRFVAQHADIADISFIRNAGDVSFLLDTLEQIAQESEDPEGVRNLGIVLKIETIPGYEGLPGILLEGMRHANLGVMVARGDLAVELGFERMAEVPRLIMSIAEAAHVPTIMATQVLENLAKTGLPARAEITDAAYALRAEAVMLNKGPYINDAIHILNSLSQTLGASQRKNRMLLRRIKSWGSEQ